MPYAPRSHLSKRERQRKQQLDLRRGTPAERGYDKDWYAVREVFIKEHPLCLFCEQEGKVVPAEVVDHIISISEDPSLRLVKSNLRSLCKRHHDSRTAREQGFAKSL